MSEMTTLFPGKELTLNNGSKVMIVPLKFGQIPKALAFVDKINSKVTLVTGQSVSPQEFMMKAMSVAGEDLFELLSYAMKTPREWFDELDADEGLNIIMTFVEVNFSFFVQKVGPLLQQGSQEIMSLVQKTRTSGPEELSALPEPVSA